MGVSPEVTLHPYIPCLERLGVLQSHPSVRCTVCVKELQVVTPRPYTSKNYCMWLRGLVCLAPPVAEHHPAALTGNQKGKQLI